LVGYTQNPCISIKHTVLWKANMSAASLHITTAPISHNFFWSVGEISPHKRPFNFISYGTPVPKPILFYDKIFLLSCLKKRMKESSPVTSQT